MCHYKVNEEVRIVKKLVISNLFRVNSKMNSEKSLYWQLEEGLKKFGTKFISAEERKVYHIIYSEISLWRWK